MRATVPVRLLGALTACYGGFALGRPACLVRQAELGDPAEPPAAARLLSTTYGVRDLLSGAAMVAAPAGAALRVAVVARTAFDLSDAVALAAVSPRAGSRRRRAAALAAGWALLCAGAGVLARDGAVR